MNLTIKHAHIVMNLNSSTYWMEFIWFVNPTEPKKIRKRSCLEINTQEIISHF